MAEDKPKIRVVKLTGSPTLRALKKKAKPPKNGRKKAKKYSPEELDTIANGLHVSAEFDLKEDPTSTPTSAEYTEDGSGNLKKSFPQRTRGTKEHLELRRKQVLRLLLRGVPKLTIAEHLQVSMQTLYGDIKAVHHELATGLQTMDFPLFVSMSMAFYEEARNIALRMATDTNNKDVKEKISALTAALRAESEKHSFLEKAGLYRYAKPEATFPSAVQGQAEYRDDSDFSDFMRLLTAGGDSSGALDNYVGSVDASFEKVPN